MQRAIVVLPLPDSPTRATHSPLVTLKDTSSTADHGRSAAAVDRAQVRDGEQRDRSLGARGTTLARLERMAPASAPSGGSARGDPLPTVMQAAGRASSHAGIRSSHRGANAQAADRRPAPTATPGIPEAGAAVRGSGTLETSPRL